MSRLKIDGAEKIASKFRNSVLNVANSRLQLQEMPTRKGDLFYCR